MAFQPGQAMELNNLQIVGQFGRAMRKVGKPVVLVPLGTQLHAGHVSMIRAASQIMGGVVVVAWAGETIPRTLIDEHVDAVWLYSDKKLWPHGRRSGVMPIDHGLEDAVAIAEETTRILALIGALAPTMVVLGEKDYELVQAVHVATRDLHIPVDVRGVPTVRMPDGVAISGRNASVAEDAREQATALAAALTAGAHMAEQGEDVVVSTAFSVLKAAGVEPEYLQLRGVDLGPPPTEGDARLLVAATVGGVRLIDNVGVPIGIGFKNLGEDG